MSKEEVQGAYDALDRLCTSIRTFIEQHARTSQYRAPVIDYHHPDSYRQRAIQGLSRFRSHAESEKDYVAGLLSSKIQPKDLTTNAPNILAIWDEFQRAEGPMVAIGHIVELRQGGQVKIDVIARGGDQWVKVNTIKESRLMAEFREQDSYLNSDYDSDASDEAESSSSPRRRPASPALTNSIITQATQLARAAQAYPRRGGFPTPKIRYVLNRLPEHPEGEYADPRIPATFTAVREMGIDLVLGQSNTSLRKGRFEKPLEPTKRIILDLSVLVALCCDSTHHPLPRSEEELEGRFLPLQRKANGAVELVEHTNVSRDLRDQLRWESQHPVVCEMQERLREVTSDGRDLEFWVTSEVRDRLPGIVDIIGGPMEKRRAAALFGQEDDFWMGSRYEGKEGILKHLRARVLDDTCPDSDSQRTHTVFEKALIRTCNQMLLNLDPNNPTPPPPPPPPPPSPPPPPHRKSRHPRRTTTVSSPSRLPSEHTLRTLLEGVRRGMTVLTNNRGAVGKIMREMGVMEGIPWDDLGDGDKEVAAIWVVNPSSLAEWRRLEVEEANKALRGVRDTT